MLTRTFLLFTLSCFTSFAYAQVPLPTVKILTTDPGTGPEDRDVPFLAWHEDLTADGYEEIELQLSGFANIYDNQGADNDEVNQSPVPVAISSGNPYTTRMLLRKPANEEDFNGVIYLEILNATARYDGAPMWNLTYPSIIADGAAWVGVTYSETAAAFMRDTWGTANRPAPASAQPRNNSRYANLNVPVRDYTWDMLSQAAALIRSPGAAGNPFGNWPVTAVIITGYSQSAAFSATYANSFYPQYSAQDPAGPCEPNAAPENTTCTPIVNGFIIAAGGPSGRRFNGLKSYPIGDPRNFESGRAKTVRFTSESDIKSVQVRQTGDAEPALSRTYEAAGTSHVDFWGSEVGNAVAEYQFGTTGSNTNACRLPLNPLRTGIPLSAIQHRLARWITFDEEPPASRLIEFTGTFANENAPDEDLSPPAWLRDDGDTDATDGDNGKADFNVIGGVRPPRIQIPLGTYYGSNFYDGPILNPDFPPPAKIFCTGIIGGFDAFDSGQLLTRYTDRREFVIKTWWLVWTSYIEGFMLAVDAKTIMDEAKVFEGLPPREN